MSQVLRVAWYRFRATFASRWGGYLSVVVLVGLTGGIAMASLSAARRTQSSYPTFLASTNPSDMSVSVFVPNSDGVVAAFTAKIAHLPGVKVVRTVLNPAFIPLAPTGAPRLNTLAYVSALASLDGAFLDQDRPAVLDGRRAAPGQPDQMVMTATAARLLGVHVGHVVPMGFYPAASLPARGPRQSLLRSCPVTVWRPMTRSSWAQPRLPCSTSPSVMCP
jgi:hypothetical protein